MNADEIQTIAKVASACIYAREFGIYGLTAMRAPILQEDHAKDEVPLEGWYFVVVLSTPTPMVIAKHTDFGPDKCLERLTIRDMDEAAAVIRRVAP